MWNPVGVAGVDSRRVVCRVARHLPHLPEPDWHTNPRDRGTDSGLIRSFCPWRVDGAWLRRLGGACRVRIRHVELAARRRPHAAGIAQAQAGVPGAGHRPAGCAVPHGNLHGPGHLHGGGVMTPQRILLTQLRRIGDTLMTTPAVRQVRLAFPDAHIAFLTEPPSDQIYRHSPHVDEVLTVPAHAGLCARLSTMLKLRRRRFDLVVDFFSNPSSAQYTWATGAPRRLGFGFRGRRWAYTETVPPPEG